MPKFRLVCRELVSVEMFVEAPNHAAACDWADKHGAEAASHHLDDQQVFDRYFDIVEPWDGVEEPECVVDEKGDPIKCESSSAETGSGQT